MFTILVVVRKRSDVSMEEFIRVWKEEYGPMYSQMPQVKSYCQYHLSDRRKTRTFRWSYRYIFLRDEIGTCEKAALIWHG